MKKGIFTAGLTLIVMGSTLYAGEIRNYSVLMNGNLVVTGSDSSYQAISSRFISAAGYITEAEGIRTYDLRAAFDDDGLFRGQPNNGRGGVYFDGWEELSPYTRHVQSGSYLTINETLFHGTNSRLTGNPVMAADGRKITIPFEILASPARPRVSYVIEFTLQPDLILGDSNGDCRVDLNDLNAIRGDLGLTGENLPSDLNKDGQVGLEDLNLVRNNFGASCAASPQTILSRGAKAKKTQKNSTR